jgi:hypothetical protein
MHTYIHTFRGAIVAWNVALNEAQCIDKLVIMNVPHPVAFKKNASFAQFLKSWVRSIVITIYSNYQWHGCDVCACKYTVQFLF